MSCCGTSRGRCRVLLCVVLQQAPPPLSSAPPSPRSLNIFFPLPHAVPFHLCPRVSPSPPDSDRNQPFPLSSFPSPHPHPPCVAPSLSLCFTPATQLYLSNDLPSGVGDNVPAKAAAGTGKADGAPATPLVRDPQKALASLATAAGLGHLEAMFQAALLHAEEDPLGLSHCKVKKEHVTLRSIEGRVLSAVVMGSFFVSCSSLLCFFLSCFCVFAVGGIPDQRHGARSTYSPRSLFSLYHAVELGVPVIIAYFHWTMLISLVSPYFFF